MIERKSRQGAIRGFSLVEMAVVLVIFGLLIGALVMPLSGQLNVKRTSETRQDLENIKSALVGFAVLYGRLPCPSVITDPTDANYGVEISPCPVLAAEGYLPWKTLGMPETDAWSSPRVDAASPGLWHYRVNSNYAISFTISTTTTTSENIIVRNTAGNNLTTLTENPVVVVFSTGENQVADGENAIFEAANAIYQADVQTNAFDDQLVWIGRPALISRMISAGKLP